MKHYDYVEWILYKNNLLDDDIHKKMEEHLYLCDDCMEIFLSLIDEAEIEKAGNLVSMDFTQHVMDNIKIIRPIKKQIKKRVKASNDFFIYYAAVASVAIILTAGGFFEKIVESVPQITVNMHVNESRFEANAIYNFTESIASKTSSFINNFQFKIVKED